MIAVVNELGQIVIRARSTREARDELAGLLAEMRAWTIAERDLEKILVRIQRLRGFSREGAVQFLRDVMSFVV